MCVDRDDFDDDDDDDETNYYKPDDVQITRMFRTSIYLYASNICVCMCAFISIRNAYMYIYIYIRVPCDKNCPADSGGFTSRHHRPVPRAQNLNYRQLQEGAL